MNRTEIHDRISVIIWETLGYGPEDIAARANLPELVLDEPLINTSCGGLGLDSLDWVEIIMAMDEEFEMEIPEAASERLKTLRDLVTYVETHRP